MAAYAAGSKVAPPFDRQWRHQWAGRIRPIMNNIILKCYRLVLPKSSKRLVAAENSPGGVSRNNAKMVRADRS